MVVVKIRNIMFFAISECFIDIQIANGGTDHFPAPLQQGGLEKWRNTGNRLTVGVDKLNLQPSNGTEQDPYNEWDET